MKIMKTDKFVNAAIIILLVISVIFLSISLCSGNKYGNLPLNIALTCVVFSNSLMVYKSRKNKK